MTAVSRFCMSLYFHKRSCEPWRGVALLYDRRQARGADPCVCHANYARDQHFGTFRIACGCLSLSSVRCMDVRMTFQIFYVISLTVEVDKEGQRANPQRPKLHYEMMRLCSINAFAQGALLRPAPEPVSNSNFQKRTLLAVACKMASSEVRRSNQYGIA